MGYRKMVKSGSLIEYWEYEKELPIRRKSPHFKRGFSKGGVKRDRSTAQRTPDNIRRARAAFRRLVRANLFGTEKPFLLTLTMLEVVPYEASSRLFHRFIARLRREEGQYFRYIAVPEFQKRGALHYHLLLWGLPAHYACTGYFAKRGKKKYFIETCDESRACESSTRYLARLWLRGFCDCIETDGHPKLASYLAKYLSKHLSDVRLGGKKAYFCSRNTVRPLSLSSRAEMFDDYKKLIPVDNPLRQFEFDTQWLGRAHYKSFVVEKKYESGTDVQTGDNE